MPHFYQPTLRAIEERREESGIYQTLDSVGVTVIKADEAASKRTKVVPKFSIWYLGTEFVPS